MVNLRQQEIIFPIVKNGNWKYFYQNGQIEQLGVYVNGNADSTWNWYYPSGKLLRHEIFLDGLADGMMTEIC